MILKKKKRDLKEAAKDTLRIHEQRKYIRELRQEGKDGE
jgi:hypothetical protein